MGSKLIKVVNKKDVYIVRRSVLLHIKKATQEGGFNLNYLLARSWSTRPLAYGVYVRNQVLLNRHP